MIGQGCPSPSRTPLATILRPLKRRRIVVALAATMLFGLGLFSLRADEAPLVPGAEISADKETTLNAPGEVELRPGRPDMDELPSAPRGAESSLRLRIEWGGGAAWQWQGTIQVSEGALLDPRPLGIEADEPGSMWLHEGRVEVRARSPRVYDGLDVTVAAPLDAELIVQLLPADLGAGQISPPSQVVVPLATLMDQLHSSLLDRQSDGRANRLLVRRAPGDKLRVRLSGDATVFEPGERFDLEVQPHRLAAMAGSRLKMQARLLSASGKRSLWSHDRDLTLDADGTAAAIPLSLELPGQEGVYDLILTVARRGLPNRLGWKAVVEERRVQVVVLAAEPPQPPKTSQPPGDVLVEIDPAHSAWWERLPGSTMIPGFRKGPLGNGDAAPFQHALGTLVRLGPAGHEPDMSWEAYPLPVQRPGQPHVIEVEYPTDVPQTLGISVVEPNAAGAVLPIGLDSGVDVSADEIEPAARLARHRLVFWPKTKAPIVLLTNRRDGSHAVYGKIRLIGPRSATIAPLARDGGYSHLPRAFPKGETPPERLLAAYYDRPLFPENFSATDEIDAWSGRSLDDWQTFYQGGSRLVEYLNHVGYNGLMLSVLADGSSIYPSPLVEPTPRYDTGVFFASGQDPVRKDVLELLLRLFDREGLKLIPAIDFSAPLPALEQIRRGGGPAANGLEPAMVDGSTWLTKHPPRRGLAPYYNPLNESVQEAMLAVVRELADRYRHHPSFAGVALQLSADGYAQLPGTEWCLDSSTLARFERDTNIDLPAGGSAEQAALVRGRYRDDWLAWRSRTLTLFHRRLQAEIAAGRPDLKLYLAGAHMLDRPELSRRLRPVLPRASSCEEVLTELGIDPAHYRGLEQIVLLRPHRIAPLSSLPEQAVNLELNHDVKLDRLFGAEGAAASLFFHEPREARLASFDAASPFRRTYTWLVAQPVPAGRQNRQRFIHALAALDARAMFDGGWLLPLGQEAELGDLVAAYRGLPDERFETLSGPVDSDTMQPGTTQPVTIRTLSRQGRTYVYLVNDSPWKAAVTLSIRTSADRVQTLNRARRLVLEGQAPQRFLNVDLEPYDLVAATLADPRARISEPRVSLADDVPDQLDARIHELWQRLAVLQDPPPLDILSNWDFEEPADADGQIPHWTVGASGAGDASDRAGAEATGGEARLDGDQPRAGKQSARLNGAGAALETQEFTAPRTGWLSVSVWLRVADVSRQPALRLSLDGRLLGQPYNRAALVGQEASAPKLGPSWAEYVFEFPDLPAEGLSPLRVRFELVGPGEVWIDDVRLFQLEKLSQSQRLALAKTIQLAVVKLERREYADCGRLLAGYWPRFLETHITLAPGTVTQSSPKPSTKADAPAPPKTGVLDRVKRAFGGLLR